MAVFTTAMVVMASCLFFFGDVNYVYGDNGLVFPSADRWFSNLSVGFCANMALYIVIVAMMVYINRVYNVPRNLTYVYASTFAVLQTAIPDMAAQFQSGSVLCCVVAGCSLLLFGSFATPMCHRRVFMIFFLLSAAVASQYAYVVYIPVFVIGCAEMRILNLRVILAILLGIIAPWWLLLGFGIVGIDEFHMPQFVSIFSAIDLNETLVLLLTVGLTTLLTLTAYLLSVLKLMTYNARTRACSGFLTVMTLVTVVAMMVDFANMPAYLPLFNFCAAFQMSHFFVIHNSDRSWIMIGSIILIYYALYVWRIAI